MSQIEVYAFEDKDGNSASDWTTRDIEEAKAYARKYKLCLIARIFEYSDSELVEDYTGTDEDNDIPSDEE